MVDTTSTFWDVSGQSLQTLAFNISTQGGRMSPPPLRGEDIIVPYALGERYVPKIAGSRIIPLSMWVRGRGEDGELDGPEDRKFQENWRMLRNLLWRGGEQFELTKRFYIDGVLRTAVAKAQFWGGLEPTMKGPRAAKFSVDLKLADPYFYDSELDTVNLTNGTTVVVARGDVATQNIKITINGSRTNTKLVNSTLGLQVEYPEALTSGSTAIIDVPNWEALTTPSGVPTYDSSGKVTHTGADVWFALKPGDNSLILSSSAGIGSVQVQSRGAWI